MMLLIQSNQQSAWMPLSLQYTSQETQLFEVCNWDRYMKRDHHLVKPLILSLNCIEQVYIILIGYTKSLHKQQTWMFEAILNDM